MVTYQAIIFLYYSLGIKPYFHLRNFTHSTICIIKQKRNYILWQEPYKKIKMMSIAWIIR